MELFGVFITLHWLLLSFTEGRPVPLSRSGEPRRYSLHELEELMKELQLQGAVPTAAGTLNFEPAVVTEAPNVNFKAKGRGQAQRIKKKLTKLERIFKKAFGNPRSGELDK